MSLLLHPKHFMAEQATKITTMAAVARCEAIEEVSGEQALIKWVNDINVHGKKVCGFLTEASRRKSGKEQEPCLKTPEMTGKIDSLRHS